MTNIVQVIQEHIIIAFAIMFVIIGCRVFQANIALALGDDTPKLNGATSFNPVNHIDITGFICFLFFRFGWAKPLDISLNNFKNRFWGRIIYSLSNAFACFIIALVSTILIILNGSLTGVLASFLIGVRSISIVFGIIDLIPLPPFDGAIFISAFLSNDVEYEYFKLSKYTTLILLGLILTRTFGMILSPVVLGVTNFITKLALMLVK